MLNMRYLRIPALALALFLGLSLFLGCGQPTQQPLATVQATISKGHRYAGLPIPLRGQAVKVLENTGYTVGYCEDSKLPLWAAYRVFRVENPQTHTRPSRFLVDERTTSRVKHEDYTNSGYDRGHMAPNYAIDISCGQAAQRETFLMSNICPQLPALNRGLWAKLEMLAAKDYAQRFEEIWVICGPVFRGARKRLPAGVVVPDAFFMVFLDEEADRPRMLAFLVAQNAKAGDEPAASMVSVDDVERAAGLDFFAELEDHLEGRLEAERGAGLW